MVNTFETLIPQPVSLTVLDGAFPLSGDVVISAPPASPELKRLGLVLSAYLAQATGYTLPVEESAGAPPVGAIRLALQADAELGAEGYELQISPAGVKLSAPAPAGIFWGIQTLRQLLPVAAEQARSLPAVSIRDYPRYAWRGVMLDVSRHFFSPADARRVVDLMAYYKMNRLHLHLSDDQGWRIEIKSWPSLATYGGSTEVGGGPGGYYTQEEYAALAAYVQDNFMILVPEIDMPGHTNAALAAYPELNCSQRAPALYTGIEVGFSSLCTTREETYWFLNDVIGEIAALTPGPYFHIGGDEAASTEKELYIPFVERVQGIVQARGKQMIGWGEIAQTNLVSTTIVQHWQGTAALEAIPQGNKFILSPSNRTYLDMKYHPDTPLGLYWAGYIEVQTAYDWDPASLLEGLPEERILGIEAPLWSETLETMADIEYMLFPRLPGLAEMGWTPQASREWEGFRLRLAAHGPRLAALSVKYYPSTQIPWPDQP